MGKDRQRLRTRSKIDELPADIKAQVLEMISDTTKTYTDIAESLKEKGYDISRSCVGRYAYTSRATLQRLQKAQEEAKLLIEVVKSNPNEDYTEAGLQILTRELTKRLATAEEEFDAMPIDKAARVMVQLTRADTYKKKAKQEMKTRAELAFEKMETEILKTIKADENLAIQLHTILAQAKEKMMQDD